MVGRNEARHLLLRPIETQRLAELSISSGQRKLVHLASRGERRNSEHSVELVQTDQPADDILTCPQCDEPVAPGGRFVADFRTDEFGRCGRNLANARLELTERRC